MDIFTIDTVGSTAASVSSSKPLVQVHSSYRSVFSGQSAASSPAKIDLEQKNQDSEDESDDDYGGLPPPSKDIFEILNTNLLGESSSRPTSTYLNHHTRPASSSQTTVGVAELASTNVDGHMKMAVITPATEKQKDLAKLSMTDRQIQELNRKERAKSKGKNWFDLPAPEMTDEVKNELELLRMRSVLDPKHFYKRSEMKTLPKYFQIGKVMDSPLDYYNERGSKKANSKTLVDELLEDAAFQKYNKRKYAEVLEKRKKKAYYKASMKMKKLKKKKK
ncbi:deoxynucleotidyltransferase terminal-interacting protein 2-like [Uranotaenia lowii]|uniref:deoxynucleotidyltransferase terminal-interacting protein 2-like n=1 Tax=Uranotaenia lowii TaxID=190385 RepID=UPI00247951E3|nr:deoxynucleotidyltransferase terminal-interacting protein 2-like [Uranotaenia lowii]XP_055597181.1 deoxynucleotidyltransferase terminal-interacting protein 2-like [Uranotaenia lowii]